MISETEKSDILNIELPTNLDVEKVKRSLFSTLKGEIPFYIRSMGKSQMLVPDMFLLSSEFMDKYSFGSKKSNSANQFVFDFNDGSNYLIKASCDYLKNSIGTYTKKFTTPEGRTQNQDILDLLQMNNVPHIPIGMTCDGIDVVESDENIYFFATPNLGCNELYIIESLEPKHFKGLANGSAIEQAFHKMWNLVEKYSVENGGVDGIIYESNEHPTVELDTNSLDPDLYSFMHMFYVQINPELNEGRLAVGDLDHFGFKKI